MKFIEISMFKGLFTVCVLLLTLNCYQLYGDNVRVYYDAHDKSVKVHRTQNRSGITVETVSVDLTDVQTWEAAKKIFAEVRKNVWQINLYIDLQFYHNDKIYNPNLVHPDRLKRIISEENSQQEGEAFFCLGDLFYKLKSEGAEACYNQAIFAANCAKDPSLAAKVFYNLGVFYEEQGKLEETERCYQSAVDAAMGAKNLSLKARAFLNLGNLYNEQDKLEDAGKCYQNVIGAAKAVKDPSMAVRDLVSLGDLFKQQGKLEDAGKCYQRVIDAARAANNPSLEAKASSVLENLHKLSNLKPETLGN